MSSLYKDSRLYFILGANSLSAIGSGIVMITIPWLLIKESGGETTFGYVSIISTLIMFLLTCLSGKVSIVFQENLYYYVMKVLG